MDRLKTYLDAIKERNVIKVAKALSTITDQSVGIMNVLDEAVYRF